MNNDLISREALKKRFKDTGEAMFSLKRVQYLIDNAPTIELTESDIQKILRPRCMSIVTNEYLISLIGGPDRFTIDELRDWLHEIFINNSNNSLGDACLDIRDRLDGFERFCKDRRAAT